MSCWSCSGPHREWSTARSRWLGQELRDRRLAARMTVESAAEKLEWSPERVTGLELGEPVADDVDVAAYLTLFRPTGREIRRVVLLNREGERDTWLQRFDDDPSARTRTPLFEESRATGITGYHPMRLPTQLLPGERRDNLTRVNAAFYVAENVLRRTPGHVTHLLGSPAPVRIVPDRVLVVSDGFTFLDNPQDRPVAHVELLVANVFFECPADVAVYRKITEKLAEVAWDTERSRRHLESLVS